MGPLRTLGHRLTGVPTGRSSAWLVLLIAALTSGALLALGGKPHTNNDPTAKLPHSADSLRVAHLQRQLPGGESNPALVVYSRSGAPLTDTDQQAITTAGQSLAPLALNGHVPPPVYSPDHEAALVAVPLPADTNIQQLSTTVDSLRTASRANLPAGLTAQVTGGAGFTADIASAFDGANVTLLLVTVTVVAVLLIATYRSPWLWLAPLAVVGTADVVGNALIAIVSRTFSVAIDGSTTGIVDVLVFGAGTNYALLLIARYREELRRRTDRREALRQALGSAAPAIAASAATVCLSLLTLLTSVLGNDRALGVAGAVGIATAALYGLVVLPAALAVCGRGLFWPFVPRAGQADPTRTGNWARLGRLVARRPTAVLAASVVLLGLLGAGLHDARLGLSKTEQFRVRAESIDALRTLSRHFPAGAADSTVIITRAGTENAVLAAATGTPGIASARPGRHNAELAAIDVVLQAEPDSKASYDTIRTLRNRVAAVPGSDALVGGTVATNLDTRQAAVRDLKVVMPLILGVVLVVLLLLLRSLVAPLVLVATVVATFFAALGASNWLFTGWLDYAALDTNVPLLAFLFLVALGVDYNIFLATRAREEAATEGTRRGVLTALTVTGGVITSAGVLLAAVFAVLGVLPLVTLTEIGIIVGLGVLLDTLLVRTLLVPAIATLLDRRFWWPSALSRPPGGGAPNVPPGEVSTRSEAQPIGH